MHSFVSQDFLLDIFPASYINGLTGKLSVFLYFPLKIILLSFLTILLDFRPIVLILKIIKKFVEF